MYSRYILMLVLGWCAASPAAPAAEDPAVITRIKSMFMNPPRDYSTAPLWVWNDMLTDDEVLGTLRNLAEQNIKQAFVHPRPGLMTPYLSEEWFRLWKLALKEAERLDMNLWIYDENSYPSGFAGGFVPEAMPESRGRGLGFSESPLPPTWTETTIAVYRLDDAGYENLTEKVRSGEKLPEARYLTASVLRAKASPWHGGKWYVDLMYPGVTQKFLSITLDAYRREVGSQFGVRVPGSFTDEPELRPAGGIPWTEDLPQLFEKRWGYRLTDHLPALWEPMGDWKKVRHNYYALLLETFIDRWAKPYYEYCEKNAMEFTGHYWEHEWPNCVSVPDNMAMSAWQQRPGIDTLMNQYHEDTHAQFGNVRAAKEISSLANQLGRARTLSEIYGAGGWDLRFEDMKRIGDWLEVLGVNTLDQHLSYVSIRGARKRDHPQSFSYHEPWWDAYHVSASYFTRLSYALTRGEQVNKVLVIEPTTSAWMYNTAGKNPPELEKLGETFQNLVVTLEKAQVEYDLGCEDVMARLGSVASESLRIGKRSYRTVVIPALTENLNAQTMELLEGFAAVGGKILACGKPPERVNGSESGRGAALAKGPGWNNAAPEEIPAILAAENRDGFAIQRAPGEKGILYHHRRQLEDGQLLFLVNSSIESPTSGLVESPAHAIERWDPETGKTAAYPFQGDGRAVRASFSLPPSGSLLLFLSNREQAPAPPEPAVWTQVDASGLTRIRRLAPNVLTMDYVDVRAGGESRNDSYFYQASQFAFRENGMERNPWDSAVQFRDELTTRNFPADSGCEVVYHFAVRDRVPATLFLVIERPDLYRISVNGKPVAAIKGFWWLDKAFGKLDISKAVRVGENEVTLKASPFSVYHEIEAAYLLGDFALKPVEKGFDVVADQSLGLGAWNNQGCPFYSAGVSYTQHFKTGKPSGHYRISLPGWYGSVAKITVNGKPAGYVTSPPWQLDVTSLIHKGDNAVEVVVVGTLKNTLGPHHGSPALGTAWPAMFQKGPYPGPPPGEEYSTVGYGLLKPMELLQAAR